MIIRTCAFTNAGWKLIDIIEERLMEHLFEKRPENMDIDLWVKECFEYKLPILFVGAMGIAVRKIAPYVNSKLTDSAVVVIDEAGKFVIPVLSNHLGGANEIASLLVKATAGQLVITTATDSQKAFAVDIFAKKNGLRIDNREGIKKVSAKVLNDDVISMAISQCIEVNNADIPEVIKLDNPAGQHTDIFIDIPDSEIKKSALLTLIFKPYVIGVGCKKDTAYPKLESFISETLLELNIDESLIAGMASIDLKKKEKCLLYYEAKHRIPFTSFSAQELSELEGEFCDSSFVKEITGVSNVCERAAIRLAGEDSEIILHKLCRDGMTLAVCKRKARINIWEI